MADENKLNEYFARKPSQETAAVLMKRATSFYQVLRANMYLEKLMRMWDFYHGQFYAGLGFGHRVTFGGEQGELSQIPVNHFRNIAEHIINIVTSSRPVMDAKAVNTDSKSLSQTYIANGILEYYMRERKLEDCIFSAAKMAVVLGTGYVKLEWNATDGEIFDVDEETGKFNYQGDIVFSNLSPFDVVMDGTKENWNNEWLLTRSWQNRYNLMAKYPEMASKIEAIPTKSDVSRYRLNYFTNDETDDIPVFEFYHKRTEAMPDGRYLLFLDSDIILLDTKLPYRDIPIYRMVASEIMGTPYGYSPMFDIYPIQEGVNALYSTIMTNQNTFGVQNVYVPRGADINPISLEGGLNVIEANAKPEAINLTQTPAEVFKFLDTLVASMETVSGINSVVRGDPEASLRSGNALALVQSMSIQYISNLQKNYVQLIEEVGTSLINILKDFAAAPRVVQIVGKSNRQYLKEFTGEDLDSISRVIVDMGNPLSRTTAGRAQIAEQLLQMGLVKSPEQYFQVLNTGTIDSMFQGDQGQLILIQKENERLLAGQPAVAVAMDQHHVHISEHANVINDPDLRQNAELLKNVQDHIQEHLTFLRTTDPLLLQMVGEQPAPPLPQANPQPIAPNQSNEQPKEAPGSNPMAPQEGLIQAGEPIQTSNGQVINMPSIPKVPAQNLVNPQLQEAVMHNVKPGGK